MSDDAGDGYDCDICRAMGQRVEDDGSIVSTGEVADMDEAVRLTVERGDPFTDGEVEAVCVCCDRPVDLLLAMKVTRELRPTELRRLGLDPTEPTDVVGYCHRGDCFTLANTIAGW